VHNLVTVSHTVCAKCKTTQEVFTTLVHRRVSPMCVTIPNFFTLHQTVGFPKYGDSARPLKIGEFLNSERHTCPLTAANLVILSQMVGAFITKFNPSRAAFQGHTRLLEPTRINLLLVTSY